MTICEDIALQQFVTQSPVEARHVPFTYGSL
jgi:hypothetical protein